MALDHIRPILRQDQPHQRAESDFDFDRLPAHVFIQILDELELWQRYYVARVNWRFLEMSDLSVTMIDSFNFNTHFPNEDIFREVVGKFARYLRVASMCTRMCTAERFDAILELEFPRLADIDIDGWTNQVPNFLSHCPNLRRLKIRNTRTIDLGESVFPRMESVDFVSCRSNTIERVLNACPFVKNFSMNGTIDESWRLIRRLNQLFAARVNSMESISMDLHRHDWVPPLLQDGFTNMWRLRSLRVLKIGLDDITVNDINAISTSFPNLQVLRLLAWRLDGGFISALSKLKNLIDLELSAWNNFCDIDISDFVMASEAGGLRRFEITSGRLSLTMVMNIIERFPRLKYLRVWTSESTCSAVSNFATRLLKFARRDLKIFVVIDSDNEWLLESRRVRRAIEKIRRAAGTDERRPGLKLDVRLGLIRNDDLGSGFRKMIKIIWMWIVLMYHRILC